MSHRSFFAGDPHIQHENVLTFKYEDRDEFIRKFDSIEEHDETIIQNWNKVVRPIDKVYVLGDVLFGNKVTGLEKLKRLNGKLKLCIGNHDQWKKFKLSEVFYDVCLDRNFYVNQRFMFTATHRPLHPQDFRKARFNVHAHTHHKPPLSPWHLCVSMEQTNMTPVAYDTLVAYMDKYLDQEEGFEPPEHIKRGWVTNVV